MSHGSKHKILASLIWIAEQMPFGVIMNNDKTIVIMGNGPSLKDVDFRMLDEFDTFGLNSAYRAYERLDWWPKYHGCYDYRVTENHRDNFNNLIDNTPISVHQHVTLRDYK
jgi:hypothetical protein